MLTKPCEMTFFWTRQSLSAEVQCMHHKQKQIHWETNRAQGSGSLSGLAKLKYFNCCQLRPLLPSILTYPSIIFSFGQQPRYFFASGYGAVAEKEITPHSSVLAWRIPGTGEPGGLPSMGVAQSWTQLKRLSSSSSMGQLTWKYFK